MGDLNFAIIELKSQFEEKLSNNEIESTWVVFIKDTKQIWTHDQYFDAADDELLTKITSLENVLKEIGVSDAVKQSHVVLTQTEYDDRVNAGTIYDDVFYYITEND